jgi:hypothetical protein
MEERTDCQNQKVSNFVQINISSAMKIQSELSKLISECVNDMSALASAGKWELDAQVRIYDLLALLMDEVYAETVSAQDAESFIKEYGQVKEKLVAAYDQTALLNEVKARLAPLERACTDARFEAAAAASLHEFAKETFQTWQTSGVFMRRRALNALRERAGFRLESHRIGNYVAKTFDLMNEAQVRFATAQQRVFAADIRFKISPDLHSRVSDLLASRL